MTATITVTITAELPSFCTDKDIPLFGVHLSFAGSKDEVTTLLKELKPNFTAYQDDGGGSAKPLVVDIKPHPVPKQIKDKALLAWLDDEQKASFDTPPEDLEVVPGSTTYAAHILQGTIGWNAPIPHELGLTYVVPLKDPAAAGIEFLLPFSKEEISEKAIPVRHDKAKGIITAGPVTLKKPNISVKVQTVPKILDLRADAIEPMGDDGFLNPVWGEDEFRLLDAVQARGQSLFWALPTFITLGSDWQSKSDQKIKNDFQIGDAQKFARNGCLLLLDPLLIALLAPGVPSPDYEGHVLAPLIRDVDAGINSLKAKITPPAKVPDRQAVLKRLRKVIVTKIQKPDSEVLLRILFSPMPVDDGKNKDPIVPTDDTLALWDSIAPPALMTSATHDLAQVLRALNMQMSSLQSEAGLEPVLIRLLTEVVGLLDDTDPSNTDQILKDALKAYKKTVLSGFNAVDAVRFDCGHVFTNDLVIATNPDASTQGDKDDKSDKVDKTDDASKTVEPDMLWTSISKMDLYTKRLLNMDSPKWFDSLAVLDPTWMNVDPDKPTALLKMLTEEWEKVVSSALPPKPQSKQTAKDARRFVPDRDPQPLPIAISRDIDATQVHDFNERFNGIAVLMRRTGEQWAHANLVALSHWKAKKLSELSPGESPYESEIHTHISPSGSAEVMRLGLRPLLPASIGGKREMFVRYQGFPLSSPAYSQTTPAGAFPDQVPSNSVRSFYQAQDVLYQSKDSSSSSTLFTTLQPPPRLNYGVLYEWSAFAISKAGVLPKTLQKSLTEPWLPTEASLNAITARSSAVYQRRTAIGSTTFATAPGTAERIGIQFPDIYPLSLDAPRIAVVANVVDQTQSATGWIDLFRNTDGTGQLKLQTQAQGVIGFVISEIQTYFLETNAKIWIDVHEAADATADTQSVAGLGLDVPPSGGKWQFALVPSDEKDVDEYKTIKVPVATATVSDQTYWVRLKILTLKGSRSLSFAPPQQVVLDLAPSSSGSTNTAKQKGESIGSHGTLPNSPPVLLVAPPPENLDESKRIFYQQFTDTAKVTCVLPRTTWLDWEHWYGKGEFRMYGQKKLQDADVIDSVLTSASVCRSMDTEFSRLLDRLPDPSVCGFIVEIAAVDKIVSSPSSLEPKLSLEPQSLEFAYDAKFLSPFTNLSSEPFPKDLESATEWMTKIRDWMIKIRAKLQAIDERFRLRINVDCTASKWDLQPGDGSTFNVSIPSGVCARLTVRPLVKKQLIKDTTSTTAFDPRMHELATGSGSFAKSGDCLIFDGASLTIEGMYDARYEDENGKGKYSDLLANHIGIATTPSVRSYRILTTKTTAVDDWRCFANIDIRTQRWRFSGRPIYSWIAPRQLVDPQKLAQVKPLAGATALPPRPVPPLDPAVPLDKQFLKDPKAGDNQVTAFEAEAYFDRDDADCELVQVRLTGDNEELKLVTWEAPSATYYRHSFAFVSRYAGGILKAGPGSPIWLWSPKSSPWTRRVAMLADPSRLEVTRPQVRCIVPLSTSPDDLAATASPVPHLDGQILAPSPPVTCILEERPFLVGGLADRITAEIATDIGYGFDTPITKAGETLDPTKIQTVQPLDLGKETSRDGRLSAWSWIPHPTDAESTTDTKTPNPVLSFVLDAEGPVGLHFEGPTVPAPAWSNCQYVLRPRSLISSQTLPEESFIGVRVRRVLDPDWLVELPTHTDDPKAVLPEKQALLHQSCVARFHLSTLDNKPDDTPLMKLVGADPHVVVQLMKINTPAATADGKPGNGIILKMGREWVLGKKDSYLPLCIVPLGDCAAIKELWFLHTPHNENNFTLSIAALPKSGSASKGVIKAPLLLATITWSTKDIPNPEKLKYVSFPLSEQVESLTSSLPTFREWARTAKNAAFVTQLDPANGESKLLNVVDLQASLKNAPSGASFSFGTKSDRQNSCWLIGSSANSRMPLYLQRHIVGLFTHRSTTLRRPIDLFSAARFLNGKSSTLKLDDSTKFDGVELHELELPAVIVAGKIGGWTSDSSDPLAKFREPYIDLISTGGNVKNTVYRLFVRFANSKESLAKATLSLKITRRNQLPNKLSDTAPSSEPFASIKCPAGVRGCDLIWSTESEFLVMRFQFWDGTTTDLTSTKWPKTTSPFPAAISISIQDVKNCDDEIWADVSLLHKQFDSDDSIQNESQLMKEIDRFHFECLFSKTDGVQAPTARSPQPPLETRTEAQARMISRSTSIPIFT